MRERTLRVLQSHWELGDNTILVEIDRRNGQILPLLWKYAVGSDIFQSRAGRKAKGFRYGRLLDPVYLEAVA